MHPECGLPPESIMGVKLSNHQKTGLSGSTSQVIPAGSIHMGVQIGVIRTVLVAKESNKKKPNSLRGTFVRALTMPLISG